MLAHHSVLSPQEQRIQREIQGDYEKQGRKRVYDIVESFQGLRPRIDVERAKYFTESFRLTEGEALILRWSKALKHIAEHMTVYIEDHQ